jgi:hypothetical protein
MGVKVGRNMRDARERSNYLKWGIYKPIFPEDTVDGVRIIYHDEISVATFKPTPEEVELGK